MPNPQDEEKEVIPKLRWGYDLEKAVERMKQMHWKGLAANISKWKQLLGIHSIFPVLQFNAKKWDPEANIWVQEG